MSGLRSAALRVARSVEYRLRDRSEPPPPQETGWAYKDGFGDPRWCQVGRYSYGTPRVHIYEGDTNQVVIGAFCSIARECELMVGGNHRADWVTTWPMKEVFGHRPVGDTLWSKGDIAIGNDVWLGHGAKVLSGVTIGDGAVVAAYTVVTKDVRPYAIVGGNPAREIKRRFDDDTVDALMRIRWWEWPDDVLNERWTDICSEDVAAFVAKYSPSGS